MEAEEAERGRAVSRGRAISTMSKRRYRDLESRLKARLGTAVAEAALMELREVMEFDPNVPQYTAELGRQRRERQRAKATELGVTLTRLLKRGETAVAADASVMPA